MLSTGENNIGEPINDYETTCNPFTNINGSKTTNCIKELVGSHYETESIWEEYELGTEVLAGTYLIKLEGEKDFMKQQIGKLHHKEKK